MPSRTIDQISAANAVHAQRVQEQMERVSPQLQPMLARLGAVQFDMVRRIWQTIQKIAAAARRLVEAAIRPFRHFLRSINQNPQKLLRWISEWWERIKEELPKGLKAMAARGWFWDGEISIGFVASFKMRIEDDPQAVEVELSEHFDERAYAIEHEVCRAHPNRREALREAFGAHRAGLYTLSIKGLLSEADGMWQDRHPRGLFSDGGPNSAAREYRSEMASGGFADIFLSPLLTRAPLWLSKKERGESFIGLNRHQVLHGETTDCYSESNSLRAISFVSYIHRVLQLQDAT